MAPNKAKAAPAKAAKATAKESAPAKEGKASAKEAKGAKAAGKKSKDADEGEELTEAQLAEGAPTVDQDEVEEAEDAAAAAASGGGGGNEAALAAASGSGEMSASFKNFRHHPDMENFYRFIYENDLRHEALAIIETVLVDKAQRKVAGGGKAKGAH